MALTQAIAPTGQRSDRLLSADNMIPERHIVIATLRDAAPKLGLTATVITTLDAMLSCLAPQRNHHTVFASNATLTFRRNGISDRTIRRHALILQDLGLIERRDSPNRKRFTKHSRLEGKILRFGFDLSPLFARLKEIAAYAAEVQMEREHLNYLRTKIRFSANRRLAKNVNDEKALNALRMLRRKLAPAHCHKILSDIDSHDDLPEADTNKESVETNNMSGTNGQNVRHHHKSTKEDIDKSNPKGLRKKDASTDVSIGTLVSTCTEAVQFSATQITSMREVIVHARTLAPMIGITSSTYEAAQKRLGPYHTAATVWIIMQMKDKVRSAGAYFHSITLGPRSAEFCVSKQIKRLETIQNNCGLSADNQLAICNS